MNLPDIRIFADGASLEQIAKQAANSAIDGFTTNPSLARRAGVKDFPLFAKRAAELAMPRPISVEVFADAPDGMYEQAVEIASWSPNIYVKVPITNTKGGLTISTVDRLAREGIKVNVTAVMTREQIDFVAHAFGMETPAYLSIFAGRIMDTGRDPAGLFHYAKDKLGTNVKTIWASPREVYNVWQAAECGADIITMGADLIDKLSLAGKDLNEFSLETVKMFHNDAQAAGFSVFPAKGFGVGGY